MFVVNWPGVGCYGEVDTVTDDFQLILIDRPDRGTGPLGDDFDIELNYDSMQWDAGEASGGNSSCQDAPDADSAVVGYSNGTTTSGDSYQLPGSQMSGALLDSNTTSGLIYHDLNSTTLGRYIFNVSNGSVTAGNRFVVIGDSVAYGHGLNNPYTIPMIGTGSAVSQGPSTQAWPSLVSSALGDSLNVRSNNCTLSGDQLSISGAQASATNASLSPVTPSSAYNYQCSGPNRSEQGTELPAADLASEPAGVIAIQGGADDIDFGECLTHEVTEGFEGKSCLDSQGNPAPRIDAELNNARSALISMIEAASPYRQKVVVVNYYDPIPSPSDFDGSSSHSHGGINPVCFGLQPNKEEASIVGSVLTDALNNRISEAVVAAKRAGDKNVVLVNISQVLLHHEMCTGSPALFSGETMKKVEFAEDLDTIVACHLLRQDCGQAQYDTTEIEEYSWRAAHPNAFGQQDIAKAVEVALGA